MDMRTYFVICVLLIWTIFTIVCVYARYWRKKAAWALLMYGRNAQFCEERQNVAKQALLAGNKDAAKLFALAGPELFDKELPLAAFYRGTIKCVFADYYFPKRYHEWISEEQWNFTRVVYQFKEGCDNCAQYFARAFRVLQPGCELTVMFMPCSTEERYRERFSSLADFLLKFRGVHSGLDNILFIGDRECKHLAEKRDEIDEGSNYIIRNDVKGKNVVIVDDLITTGDSLENYAKRLEASGAEVVGAIFLAKTFELPSERRVKWVVWKQILCSW